MFDFEVRNSVFDDRRGIDVRRGDDIGNVAVYKNVARLKTEDYCFGTAGVGAAKPDCIEIMSVSRVFGIYIYIKYGAAFCQMTHASTCSLQSRQHAA